MSGTPEYRSDFVYRENNIQPEGEFREDILLHDNSIHISDIHSDDMEIDETIYPTDGGEYRIDFILDNEEYDLNPINSLKF